MNMRSNWTHILLGVCAVATSFSLSGCSDDNQIVLRSMDASVSVALSAHSSCDAVESTMVESVVNQMIEHRVWHMAIGRGDNDASPVPSAGDDAAGGNESADTPQDYTGTNLQEQGVDEADILKTDGEHIYVVAGREVMVAQSWPIDDIEVLAHIPVKGIHPELFLQDDELVIVSQRFRLDALYPEEIIGMPGPDEMQIPCEWMGDCIGGEWDGVHIARWDVSDPSNPTAIQDLDIEGRFITTRVVDERLYLVQQHTPTLPHQEIYKAAQSVKIPKRVGNRSESYRRAYLEGRRADFRAEANKIFRDHSIDILPSFKIGENGEAGSFISCDATYRPDALSHGLDLLHITSLDLRDEQATPTGVGILSNGSVTYASPEAIYVARGSSSWNWFQNVQSEETVDIHKFEYNDGSPSYAASGRVPGFIRDRFVMSEKDDVFRIATTDRSNRWAIGIVDDVVSGPPTVDGDRPVSSEGATNPEGGTTSSDDDTGTGGTPTDMAPLQANNLFTLVQSGRNLEILGEVRGYGATEQIYGTRYVGDMAYVVTFRQTDPLYAIDLSDPANPTIRGELKIPGFSNFLQSIEDGWLVGIGKETDESGWVIGFQVQLFDVRDPETPTRTAQHLILTSHGSASSEAELESRAFTWSPRHQVLATPVTIWSYDEHDSFFGLMLFRITPEDGITEIGRIEHSALIDSACSGAEDCKYWWNSPMMRRSTFIDDYIFALSTGALSVSPVEAPEDVLFLAPF